MRHYLTEAVLARPMTAQKIENRLLNLARLQKLVASAQASFRIDDGATPVRLAEEAAARALVPVIPEPGIFGPNQGQHRLGFRCVDPGLLGPARVASPALDNPRSKGMIRTRG